VNIKYSTIKYSRITNTKKSLTIQRVDNKAFIKPCSSGSGGWNLVWCRNLWLWTIRGGGSR